jgi:hypothetical protein
MVIRYLLADGLSLLGNSVAAVALPLLMLARTGDAAAAGVIARRARCRRSWPRSSVSSGRGDTSLRTERLVADWATSLPPAQRRLMERVVELGSQAAEKPVQ